jgi:hypothetical protein
METAGSKTAGGITASVGGRLGIPLVAQGKADVQGSATFDSNTSIAKKAALSNLDQVVKEIGGSDFVVFIDDFHYIVKTVRDEIGKEIKAAAEKGVRICTASVPHRADELLEATQNFADE